MARLHHSRSQLYKDYSRSQLLMLVSSVLIVASAAILYFYKYVFAIPAFVAFLVLTGWLNRRCRILQSGVEGEQKALKLSKYLPAGYHIFNNIPLSYEEQKGEIDLLVVGPNGVFIIEVKNLRGRIQGYENDKGWLQTKLSKKGNAYKHPTVNPVKQVKREIFLLSHCLEESGWIQGIVWFTHKDVNIAVNTQTIPVFSSGKSLASYITRYKSRHPLEPDVLDRIISRLEAMSV